MSMLIGPPVVTCDGIYFKKRNGARITQFLVTRAALSQLAGNHLEIRQLELEYQRFHDVIAEAARRVFSNSGRDKKLIRIGPQDVLLAMPTFRANGQS